MSMYFYELLFVLVSYMTDSPDINFMAIDDSPPSAEADWNRWPTLPYQMWTLSIQLVRPTGINLEWSKKRKTLLVKNSTNEIKPQHI